MKGNKTDGRSHNTSYLTLCTFSFQINGEKKKNKMLKEINES
jgi:hypothetical protein